MLPVFLCRLEAERRKHIGDDAIAEQEALRVRKPYTIIPASCTNAAAAAAPILSAAAAATIPSSIAILSRGDPLIPSSSRRR